VVSGVTGSHVCQFNTSTFRVIPVVTAMGVVQSVDKVTILVLKVGEVIVWVQSFAGLFVRPHYVYASS
jgi:hypothetical protein